jgi:hypothetical protein
VTIPGVGTPRVPPRAQFGRRRGAAGAAMAHPLTGAGAGLSGPVLRSLRGLRRAHEMAVTRVRLRMQADCSVDPLLLKAVPLACRTSRSALDELSVPFHSSHSELSVRPIGS